MAHQRQVERNLPKKKKLWMWQANTAILFLKNFLVPFSKSTETNEHKKLLRAILSCIHQTAALERLGYLITWSREKSHKRRQGHKVDGKRESGDFRQTQELCRQASWRGRDKEGDKEGRQGGETRRGDKEGEMMRRIPLKHLSFFGD